MEYHLKGMLAPVNIKTSPSAGKVVSGAFWDVDSAVHSGSHANWSHQ